GGAHGRGGRQQRGVQRAGADRGPGILPARDGGPGVGNASASYGPVHDRRHGGWRAGSYVGGARGCRRDGPTFPVERGTDVRYDPQRWVAPLATATPEPGR